MAKSRAVVSATYDEDHRQLVFTVLGAGELTLRLDDVHDDVRLLATVKALTTRIVDAAAIPCNPETGKPATPTEKLTKMRTLVEHYSSGAATWNIAGETRPRLSSIVVQAIANLYQLDTATTIARVTALAGRQGCTYREALQTLSRATHVIAEIAQIKATRAKTSESAETFLDELTTLGEIPCD